MKILTLPSCNTSSSEKNESVNKLNEGRPMNRMGSKLKGLILQKDKTGHNYNLA